MFKIGEFSKLSQVSIRMLRYYDETGVLKPEKVDILTGYRLYSSEQISQLNKIIFLRDTGFNLSEIDEVLRHWDDTAYMGEQLRKKHMQIQERIYNEQNKLAKIDLAKTNIQRDNIQMMCNVLIKSIPSYRVLSLRKVIPDYYCEGQLWKELSVFANENDISISDSTFSIYHDPDYRETDVDVEICALTTSISAKDSSFLIRYTEAVSDMASTMVYGPFQNIAKAYLSFANWLAEHSQYKMVGNSRQIVHRGPWNEKNPDKYLTEIQIPLTKVI